MSDINRSTFSILLSQIPSNLFGILTGIIITRILGADGRGIYYIFLANSQFLLLLLGLSINLGITYFISNNKIPRPKIFGIIVFLIAIAILAAATILITLYYFGLDTVIPSNYNTKGFLFYLFGIFILQFISSVANGFLSGNKKFRPISRLTIYSSIINVILFSALFAYHLLINSVSLESVFVVSFVFQLLSTLIWCIVVIPYLNKPDFKIKAYLFPFLKYCTVGHTSMIINFFNYRFDLYVLAFYWDLTAVGFYSLSVSLAQFIWLISNPIGSVLLPYFVSANNDEERHDVLIRYARFNFSLLILAAIPLYFAAEIIPFVYGTEFDASILPFRILLIGTLISGISKTFSSYLSAQNLIIINLKATIIGLIITIIMDFILIPDYGIIGASLASVATYASVYYTVMHLGILKKQFEFKNYFLLTKFDISYFVRSLKSRD